MGEGRQLLSSLGIASCFSFLHACIGLDNSPGRRGVRHPVWPVSYLGLPGQDGALLDIAITCRRRLSTYILAKD
jgi:hypothetical protein